MRGTNAKLIVRVLGHSDCLTADLEAEGAGLLALALALPAKYVTGSSGDLSMRWACRAKEYKCLVVATGKRRVPNERRAQSAAASAAGVSVSAADVSVSAALAAAGMLVLDN